MKGALRTLALAATLVGTIGLAQAQQALNLTGIVELSGSGATAGTNYNNGTKLAVAEINAAGGINGQIGRASCRERVSSPV